MTDKQLKKTDIEYLRDIPSMMALELVTLWNLYVK